MSDVSKELDEFLKNSTVGVTLFAGHRDILVKELAAYVDRLVIEGQHLHRYSDEEPYTCVYCGLGVNQLHHNTELLSQSSQPLADSQDEA